LPRSFISKKSRFYLSFQFLETMNVISSYHYVIHIYTQKTIPRVDLLINKQWSEEDLKNPALSSIPISALIHAAELGKPCPTIIRPYIYGFLEATHKQDESCHEWKSHKAQTKIHNTKTKIRMRKGDVSRFFLGS